MVQSDRRIKYLTHFCYLSGLRFRFIRTNPDPILSNASESQELVLGASETLVEGINAAGPNIRPKLRVPYQPVLRIREVYPGSRILIFTHPGSRIQKQQQKRGVKKLFSYCRVPVPYLFW